MTTNPHPIVINAMDPMFCKSDLGREITGAVKVLEGIFRALTARTTEEGSRLVVQAASAGRETHGLYMRTGVVEEYAAIAKDEERATYVWDTLCKRLEKLQPVYWRTCSKRYICSHHFRCTKDNIVALGSNGRYEGSTWTVWTGVSAAPREETGATASLGTAKAMKKHLVIVFDHSLQLRTNRPTKNLSNW